MLIMTASNPTARAFRVEAVGISIEGTTKQLALMDSPTIPPLPCVLQETQTVQAFKELKYIGQSLIQSGLTQSLTLRPYFQDSYGTRHVGETVECNPREWAGE